MPAWASAAPRKILPPPTTIPISTPCFCTDLIMPTTLSKVAGSTVFSELASASPLSFNKMRLYLFMLSLGISNSHIKNRVILPSLLVIMNPLSDII